MRFIGQTLMFLSGGGYLVFLVRFFIPVKGTLDTRPWYAEFTSHMSDYLSIFLVAGVIFSIPFFIGLAMAYFGAAPEKSTPRRRR